MVNHTLGKFGLLVGLLFCATYSFAQSPSKSTAENTSTKVKKTSDAKSPLGQIEIRIKPNSDPVRKSNLQEPEVNDGTCPFLHGVPFKTTSSSRCNFCNSFGLGKTSDGDRVGSIYLLIQKYTVKSYRPEDLSYSIEKSPEIEQVPNPEVPPTVSSNGYVSYSSIRQVKSHENLLNIVVISPWEYDLRFYKPDQIGEKKNGLYKVNGEPFVIHKIKNPNPPSMTSMQNIEIRDGKEKISESNYDEASDTWTLHIDGKLVGLRQSVLSLENPCERIEIRLDLVDEKMVKKKKIFRRIFTGDVIIKLIEDPDGKALTTTYTYFEERGNPRIGSVKTITYPDGRVEEQ
jgi:hypothetical protein